MNRRATFAGLCALLLGGVAEASYGPAIPSLQHRFQLTPGGAGTIVGSHFAGIVAGSLLTGEGRRWLGRQARVVTSLGIFGIAWVFLAAAPTWPTALAATFAVGVGQGAMVVEINVVFAVEFGKRNASMSALLSAAFGAGATLVPTIIGVLPDGGERAVWGIGGVMVLALIPIARSTPADVPASPRWTARQDHRRLFLAFSAMLFLYAGLEQCIAAWETTYLGGRGFSTVIAATAVSLFWVALMIGRLASAAVVSRVGVERMVGIAFLAGVPVVLIAVAPSFAPAGLTVTGFVMAPLFPAIFVWFQQRVEEAPALSGRFMAIGQGGAAVLPVAMGELITVAGIQVFPWATAALFLVAGVGAITLARRQ